MSSPCSKNEQKILHFLAIHNKILVQWIFSFNKYLQKGEWNKKWCPHLSSVLVCRAGLEYWLHLRATWTSCTHKPVHVMVRGESELPRGTGQMGAESWRHMHTSPTRPMHCRTFPSRAAVIDSMGRVHSSSPEGTEAPLILILNFLPSLLTFCQGCFQGKLSPSLLCCQTGLMRNKKKPKPTAQVWFFCLGF